MEGPSAVKKKRMSFFNKLHKEHTSDSYSKEHSSPSYCHNSSSWLWDIQHGKGSNVFKGPGGEQQ